MTPRRIGLVADDLTGAADSAAEFAATGWCAQLVCRADAQLDDRDPSVLAVVTGVRAAGHDEAAAVTAAAVESLVARGCDRLYVKVDSTMRGAVSGQVRGALAAWAVAHPGALAVLCPAFPAQGRVVVDGDVLVDGVPLADTAAAVDPVTPVRESRLDRLVPAVDGLDVRYADAASDRDLAEIAAGLDELGPRAVAVGSAGLAGALAARWPVGPPVPGPPVGPAARILVGVSSLHPVALESVERLRHAMLPSGMGTLAVDVVTPPPARTDPVLAAATFGRRVAEQFGAAPYDVLVLVGGDGAAAALGALGAAAVTIRATLAPGVPLGTIRGGPADNVRVVTTSGGFGGPDSLVRILDNLQ